MSGGALLPSVRLYWRTRRRKARAPFPGAWAWLDVHHPELRGGRAQWSAETQDPAEAEGIRAAVQARLDAGLSPAPREEPTVGHALDLYLAEGLGDLAGSTRRGVRSQADRVREGLGGVALPELDERTLWRWWRAQERASEKTRRNRLDALAGALWLASQEGLPGLEAVRAFRASLRRRGRGKAARAGADPARGIRALESGAELAALLARVRARETAPVASGRDRRRRPHTRSRSAAERATARADLLAVLLGLDAGLRLGEIRGLRWGQVLDGALRGPDDPARRLVVDRSWPGGGRPDEPPKGGRVRSVPMSRRLQRALRESWLEAGRPEKAHVLPGLDPRAFGRRLARDAREAGVAEARPKDLRSTFASQLLSMGIPPTWIARALGHSTTQLTETRYARWIPDGYREPERLTPGEVVTDLLARLEDFSPESASLEDVQPPRPCPGAQRDTRGTRTRNSEG